MPKERSKEVIEKEVPHGENAHQDGFGPADRDIPHGSQDHNDSTVVDSAWGAEGIVQMASELEQYTSGVCVVCGKRWSGVVRVLGLGDCARAKDHTQSASNRLEGG
jgi:hypothetical protein